MPSDFHWRLEKSWPTMTLNDGILEKDALMTGQIIKNLESLVEAGMSKEEK